ncbi:hypothetical protein [Clostridium saccharoperbutylacetonicum]|uniref:hypothetical protein n=1 Tax=Clostridium saccharoperbutylacetonicum TaxID=36745 RepID=UPI0039E8CF12
MNERTDIVLEDYFVEAFWKLYEENQKEDIKPELYVKNIEVMLQISNIWSI